MNNKKEVIIKIENLENDSYLERYVNCDMCRFNSNCTDMTTCPIIAHISSDVLRTTYNIDKSVLRINTAAYGHDCRRVSNVVNMARDMCRLKR